MTRITCRTPSTGKSLSLSREDVPTTFFSLYDAPDFSVPDASEKFTDRDSSDSSRAIRPGEVFFLTPMAAKNKDSVIRWIDTQIVREDGSTIEVGRVEIPPGDTAFIPLQGRSLLKRQPTAATTGDQLQIRAETASTIDVWVAAEEKLSSEHTGVV